MSTKTNLLNQNLYSSPSTTGYTESSFQGVASNEVENQTSQNQTSRIGAQQIPTHLNNPYLYRFPANYIIHLTGKKPVDISNIDLDLTCIFRGGIGYGASASKLMSRAMKAINHEGCVYSLPFCLEGLLGVEEKWQSLKMISTKNEVAEISVVQSEIAAAINSGYTNIHISIDLNGHASLAAIVIQNNAAVIRFYDSLSPKIMSYEKRYCEKLVSFFKSLLPSTVTTTQDKPEVLHLLDQGGEDSKGCGYYALFTAVLLKEDPSLRNLVSYQDAPFFNENDDQAIRADLVVRTLLDYGLENVNTNFIFEPNSYDYIFDRVATQFKKLIKVLSPRLESTK